MNKTLLIGLFVALALVFSVSAYGNLNIVESSVAISGNPGDVNGSKFVTISNTGAFDLNNTVVNVTDLVGSGVNISKSALQIFKTPLDLTTSSPSYVEALILTIPSGQKAGLYTGTIRAEHNSSHYDTAQVHVTVNPVYGYSASADTPSVAKGFSGSITVTVTNTGNADLSGLTWKVSNPFTSGTYMLSPTTTSGSMSVTQGSSATFSVPFSPSSSQASGTYTGQLNLTHSSGSKTLTLNVVVKDPTYSVSMPEVQFSESEREVNVSQTITITNNGDLALTNVALTTTAANTWITSSLVGTTLAKGASFTATLTSTVPETADSGVDKIGDLKFSSNEFNKTVAINTNAKSMLEFDSVKVSIDDGSWDSVSDGGTVDDDARPGDEFAVKVKLENLFDDDDNDYDIEDIEIRATFFGAGEDGDDIDGDSEDFDVDAGEKSSEEEINFDDDVIDWDANAGKLKMEITADGTDGNGAKHSVTHTVYVNVERESNAEIIFTRFDAPSSVECGRSFTIYADGRNIGEKSDDEVVLKIENSNLGIALKEEFEMGAYDDEDCDAFEDDEDDCNEFSYRSTVQLPSGISTGTHTLVAKLYRDTDRQTDEEDIQITVTCSGTSSSSSSSGTSSGSTSSGTTSGSTSSGASTTGSTSGTSSGTTTGTTPSTTTSSVQVLYGGGQATSTPGKGIVATSPTKIIDTSKKSGFRDSNAYLALLSILSVLIIVAIIITLVVAFSHPRD